MENETKQYGERLDAWVDDEQWARYGFTFGDASRETLLPVYFGWVGY